MMAEAIEILSAQGATIVDPADIPSVIDPDPTNSLLTGGGSSVLSYGMKRDFNAWLATLGESAPDRPSRNAVGERFRCRRSWTSARSPKLDSARR